MSSQRRSVTFATRGRIVAKTAAITIATIGFIVLTDPTSPPPQNHYNPNYVSIGGVDTNDDLLTDEEILIEDSFLIEIVKLTIKTTII